MRKINLLITLLFLLCSIIVAQEKNNSELGFPIRAHLNLNNISTIFKNTGISDIDPSQVASGFVYPFGSGKTAVYVSGLIWGAKIVGDPQVRVGGSTYREGLQCGWIDESGTVHPPSDPRSRIYRVRPDVYIGGPTVDLSKEAGDEGKSIFEVRAQYELDWTEWPGDLGAPFYDGDGDGIYNPNPISGDIPGVYGAKQTIWFVANDHDPSLTLNLYGTDPIGIEYQATIWEYTDSLGFDNLFFRKYKLINKTDVLGDPTTFSNMYISMWSDPDVGDAGDDFVGCDTLLNLGFGYNGFDTDLVYNPLPPPAIGFDLIRGPLVMGNANEDRNRNGIVDIYDYGLTENNERVYGFINLAMTAFYYFVRDDSVLTDPPLGTPDGASQFYNFMQGKIGLTGDPFIDPITNQPTKFPLSGNPVTGDGWIDGILHSPNDRRLGLSTGPFQMEPGDTQVVVVAEIAGGAIVGIDYLSAIDTVKIYSQIAQNFYDNTFPVTVDESNIFPENFRLEQNFPNPFNPSTQIKYSIPHLSNVIIKVFDILGNEIEILAKEEKPAGTYELTWYAEGLPSGVYFYRLQAVDYVETKKMILLK
jgi:hypothetical protein